jgi:lon-related putative ATP-dependent protease
MITSLAPSQLRREVDPATLGVQSTASLTPLDGIIGQQRALNALEFGLGMRDSGFNVYVAGEPGLGKMTAVRAFLQTQADKQPPAPAWCYVNNFSDPSQPVALLLPPGRARAFQHDVQRVIERVRREIPKAFESEEYAGQRDALGKAFDDKRNQLLGALRSRAQEYGVTLQMTPYGIVTLPLRDGEPIPQQVFDTLPPAEQTALRERNDAFQEHVRATMKAGRELDRSMQEQIGALNKKVAQYVVDGLMDDLCDTYADLPHIVAHLRAMQEDILNNIELFQSQSNSEDGPPAAAQMPAWVREAPLRKYAVNVLVDPGAAAGAPVVVELNANSANLFGRIERESQFGTLYTDFTMIKAGALHRANGGYLVLGIEDVLRNPYSWDGLKRALRSREIRVEDISEQLGFGGTRSLRPQPLPLALKVVLIGRPLYYHLLCAYDEDFAELFKVKADFDTQTARTPENIERYIRFVHTLCEREQLRHLDASALAELLEYASRLAEDQSKLSTQFGMLTDIVREASYWAERSSAAMVDASHVQKSLAQRVYRGSLIQDRLQEMIARGLLLIDIDGAEVGQINGLSVISIGDLAFGKPSRITASIEPGRAGIVDIEREVALGGPIHSKGVLILSGYLAHRYGGDKPITLNARLVFEQSYAGVEGDSASCAELYALLSALADAPIQQGIAVTGSVNQHGDVQAIGGVNEKIEGHFDVCCAKGLTGRQGVLIPASNTQNLMLRPDVVDAVRAGQFHVWPVSTIDEGIEILTGLPAGARGTTGRFPHGSLNARVDARLNELVAQLRAAADDKDGQRHRHDDLRQLPRI